MCRMRKPRFSLMAYAFNIRSENETSNPLLSLWQQCSCFERSPSMAQLSYPPHITLAIYDDLAPESLLDAFSIASMGIDKFTISFRSLGYFEAPNAIILWAAPEPSDALASIHTRIHSQIEPELCRANYRPGRWVPHSSLATSIEYSHRDEAIAFANKTIDPFEVVFDFFDCASFPPVKITRKMRLNETGS